MASVQTTSRTRVGVLGTVQSVLLIIGRGAREFLRLSTATTTGRIGLPIVAAHAFVAIFGSMVAPYPFDEFHVPPLFPAEHQLSGPTWTYLLGTDQFGRDVFSRVLSGAGSLIGISLAGALLGIFLGTVIGMSSGYRGGRVDEVVMRIMDGALAFPGLLLALLVLTTLGAREAPWEWLDDNWESLLIILTVGVVHAPSISRVLRSVTLKTKNLEFVMSARLRGENAPYVIFREILPNALPVLAVELPVRLSYSILIVSTLGFLGLGVQPPSPDWGRMIGEGRQYIGVAPWMTLAPAGAVATLVVGVNLLTDGIKQASGLPREIIR